MAMSFVQETTAAVQAGTGSDTVVNAYGSNVTAGNLLVAVCVTGSTALGAGAVTDNLNGTWDLAVADKRGSDEAVAIYYKKNTAGGACTVTLNPASNDFCSLALAEFTNGALTGTTDGTNSNTTNTGTAFTAGSITPSVAGVIVGVMSHNGSTVTLTATNGFSDGSQNTNASNMPITLAYAITTGGTPYNASWTLGGSGGDGSAAAAAFAAAGVGGPDLNVSAIGEPVIGGSTF